MHRWLAPLLLGLFGVAILLGLGFWQLQRLERKENLINELDAQMQIPPVPIEEIDLGDLERESGRAVFLRGEFGSKGTDLLSGDSHGAGYRRLAAFHTKDLSVIAELGFLPESKKDVPLNLPIGEVEVTGRIYAPNVTNGSYDERLDVWVGMNPNAMAELLGAEPVVVALDRAPQPELVDTPLEIDLPNNHLQYAITWFLLAIAWALMALYWGFKRRMEKT